MKFLSQFLSKAAGQNAVNVIVVGKVENIEAEAEQVVRMATTTLEENRRLRAENRMLHTELKAKRDVKEGRVLPILDTLKPPRIINLEKKMLLECMEHFQSQKAAAEYIGWSRRAMNYRLQKFGLRAIDQQEEE